MANVITKRRSGFITRDGRSRRETVWFDLAASVNSFAAAGTAALIASLNAGALALRPFTVVRTRMQWLCRSDQSAATESFFANFGLAVVSDQAVAIGVTAIPTPATDRGSDLWFVLETWPGRFDLVGTDVSQDLVSREIDSKAMRKVDQGQDIVFVGEAGLVQSGCAIHAVGRMLVKLH